MVIQYYGDQLEKRTSYNDNVVYLQESACAIGVESHLEWFSEPTSGIKSKLSCEAMEDKKDSMTCNRV